MVLVAEREGRELSHTKFARKRVHDPVEHADIRIVDFIPVDVSAGLPPARTRRAGLLGEVHLTGPIIAIDRIEGVSQFDGDGRNALQELVVLVDDLDEDAIAVLGGHPGEEDAELNDSRRNLACAELVHR